MFTLDKIIAGRTDLVFEYLAKGKPATSKDPNGRPLIHWCAYHGDVSAIRYLLANGESADALGKNFGLESAAFHGYWKLCQYLIELGADVNFASPVTGETPLHAALSKANRFDDDDVVAVLLAKGANPNLKTKPGEETGGFMRGCRTKAETPLHRAAAFGSEKTVNHLLEAGADRELKDANDETPLSWASWHLRPPVILRLLSFGERSGYPDHASSDGHGNGWGQF